MSRWSVQAEGWECSAPQSHSGQQRLCRLGAAPSGEHGFLSVAGAGQQQACRAVALCSDSEVTHVTSDWSPLARIVKSLCPIVQRGLGDTGKQMDEHIYFLSVVPTLGLVPLWARDFIASQVTSGSRLSTSRERNLGLKPPA